MSKEEMEMDHLRNSITDLVKANSHWLAVDLCIYDEDESPILCTVASVRREVFREVLARLEDCDHGSFMPEPIDRRRFLRLRYWLREQAGVKEE